LNKKWALKNQLRAIVLHEYKGREHLLSEALFVQKSRQNWQNLNALLKYKVQFLFEQLCYNPHRDYFLWIMEFPS